MTTAPAWWRAGGGPWCVSIWSAIIGVIFLVPSAVWSAVNSELTLPAVLVSEAVAAIVVLTVLWLSHGWWLSPSRAHQPGRTWLALATFVLLGVLRIAVLFIGRELLGVAQPWSVMAAMVSGALYSVVILGLVAIVVNAVREHARTMSDLEHAQQSLSRVAAVEADEVEALQHDYVGRIVDQVRTEIMDLRGSADPSVVGPGIQEVSDRLVRAGSHSLQSGEVLEAALTVPKTRVEARRVLRGVRPATPIIGPVVFEALVFSAVLRDFGWALALMNAVVATLVLIAGNVILCRISQNHWPQRGRLPLLIVSYLIIGFAAAGAVQIGLVWAGSDQHMWVGAIPVAIFMTLTSIFSSLWRQQSAAEAELAESLVPLAAESARVRNLAEEQRRRLSHLMHGGLQAEMTAAAVAMSRSQDCGDKSGDVARRIDSLVELVAEQFAAVDEGAPTQSVEDLLETWGYALDLDVQVSQAAQAALRGDPDLSRRVVDVISEAFTNVVRHGANRQAEVRLAVADGDLELWVSSLGELASGADGLGSQQLSALESSWSREQAGDRVVLRVHFGAGVATDARPISL